ncbi:MULTISPECIES: 2-hydroxy-acid oxidase [unclassified Micromonospora]|uniref:2-hydroxy-acid oxidase n=1 Tax=unclassified Micromonospora TaxID=2617518 RepID=UPI00188F586B|nr:MULTISPECIES: 2-hydroxy-acid oxidase [unclassified Micromonospora]MBF5028850.1 2-hydroxy-acid oxidase [Micromonospora sp. ANENR4]MCZ7476021.1 2-hydroxy-acid oxidase [Micromonospora sp. WMMC273]WBC00883.1 2-hydroxy-acid oxidase [Micromonospora sp. WMMA1976]
MESGLRLLRAARQTVTGPAALLGDPVLRERSAGYLRDLARPYGLRVPDGLFDAPSAALGQSYGEMAAELIPAVVPPDEPVDLLVLAFAVHDVLPGRATAAYLSHVCPGTPMSFALCDQGSAAAFTGLRIARDYGCRRALLVTVEQAVLPYDAAVPVPARHRAVAMLYGTAADDNADSGTGGGPERIGLGAGARLTGLRQHADVGPGEVAALAAAEVRELTAGRTDVAVVLGAELAAVWPGPGGGAVTTGPERQPSTGLWWALLDRLAGDAARPRPVVVVADYEPGLGYLSVAALAPAGRSEPVGERGADERAEPLVRLRSADGDPDPGAR